MILALDGPELALICLCKEINAKVGGGKVKLLMNAGGDLLLVYVPDILELCPVSGVDLEEMLTEVLKSVPLALVIKLINGVLEGGPVL